MDHAERSSLNCFAQVGVDRLAEKRTDATWIADVLQRDDCRFLPILDGKPLVDIRDDMPRIALLKRLETDRLFDSSGTPILLGRHEDSVCFAVPCSDELAGLLEVPGVRVFSGLRSIAVQLPAREASLVAYGRAMVYWHARHRFCGSCGYPNRIGDAGHVLICENPECASRRFPRTDPAIIVLVQHGDACLLARQASWPEKHYATLAGFVEPGESLEQAVARETMEETGVRLEEVNYHSSQPWPFPGSIMLGFIARAASRALNIDPTELQDAVWLTRAAIRSRLDSGRLKLSPRLSISYRLIEHWFDAENAGELNELLTRLEAVQDVAAEWGSQT